MVEALPGLPSDDLPSDDLPSDDLPVVTVTGLTGYVGSWVALLAL